MRDLVRPSLLTRRWSALPLALLLLLSACSSNNLGAAASASSSTAASSASAAQTSSAAVTSSTAAATAPTTAASTSASASSSLATSSTVSTTAAPSATTAPSSSAIASSANSAQATTSNATTSAADWPTYHRDLARTGDWPNAPAFQTLKSAWETPALDGDVYAEPLLVNGQLLIVTENDTAYSLDAKTGKVQWKQHVGSPVPQSALPCGDIDPSGMTATPVVDPASGTLNAMAFVQPGQHELYAFDLKTGAVRFHAVVTPPNFHPLTQQERSALMLANGTVYVAFGGLDGDCGDYHGWMVALDPSNGHLRAQYQVPTQREGAIWAPAGPVVDASGNLYVATGNGSSDSQFDYGDSVIKLSSDLKVLDWFAPTDWAQLNATDADLGSLSPALLPDGLLFQVGKGGTGYLLRSDHLGHIGGQVFSGAVCSRAFGATAWQAPYLYVPCQNGLVALKVQTSDTPSFSVAWRGPSVFADTPVVGGGIVWYVERNGTLRGLDAKTGQSRFSATLPGGSGGLPHFISPTLVGGTLFVAAGPRVLAYTGGA